MKNLSEDHDEFSLFCDNTSRMLEAAFKLQDMSQNTLGCSHPPEEVQFAEGVEIGIFFDITRYI